MPGRRSGPGRRGLETRDERLATTSAIRRSLRFLGQFDRWLVVAELLERAVVRMRQVKLGQALDQWESAIGQNDAARELKLTQAVGVMRQRAAAMALRAWCEWLAEVRPALISDAHLSVSDLVSLNYGRC